MKLCLICWRSIDGDGWTVNGVHGPFCSRSCRDRFKAAADLLVLYVDARHALADLLAELLIQKDQPVTTHPWEHDDGSTNVEGFLGAYANDDNTFWRAEPGHVQNVLDELIDRANRAVRATS